MENNKDELIKEKGKLTYSLIEEVVTKVGPRLPTSKEEEMGCDLVGEQMKRELNASPVKEEFVTAPRASIAAIPLMGIGGAIMFAAFYLSPIASLIIGILLLAFAFIQIFSYSGLLDFMFKHGTSHNIYSVLEPKEEAKYTILLSGHIDTSWCWKLSYKNPKTAIPKTAIGVASVVILVGISIWAIASGAYSFMFIKTMVSSTQLTGKEIANIIMYTLPIICLPGFYWLSNYLTWDPKMASPGAMDNMSGIAIGVATAKYLQENPEEWPKNCRIIVSAMGCEESGLKGSSAFVKAHKNDPWFNDTLYNLNLDSFRDDDHFNAVNADIWLGTKFDKDLINMSIDTMKEIGVEPHIICNPVGGCDSTPFCKANIKTVTLNAQKPTTTNYYHTPNDNLEGLSMFSLEKGVELVLGMIPKIDEYEKNRKK